MAKINVEGRELGFYNVVEEDAFDLLYIQV